MSSTTSTTGTDRAWPPPGFEVRRVDANGTTLSVAVGGHGPTLVLLHGWPQTGRAFRRVMPALAERHTVVVPDLRGTGDSDRPGGGYRKTEQVRDLRGVLAALALTDPPVVVGHDIGGMIAFAWAAEFGDEVTAAVILDVVIPGLGLEDAMDVAHGGMWHFGFFMQPGIPEMLLDGHELEFFTTTFRAMSNPGTFSDDDLDRYARAYRGRDRLRGGFSHYRDLLTDGQDNHALLEERTLNPPLLAIGSSHLSKEAVEGPLRPHSPRLTTIIAPTGHFIAEEAPEWLIATLTEFLERTAGGQTA